MLDVEGDAKELLLLLVALPLWSAEESDVADDRGTEKGAEEGAACDKEAGTQAGAEVGA